MLERVLILSGAANFRKLTNFWKKKKKNWICKLSDEVWVNCKQQLTHPFRSFAI